ncbi:MAG: AMP-binding protein [Anaerolineae bacterium]|nr:AMP-binding protein [Anaerolineae bacterium]
MGTDRARCLPRLHPPFPCRGAVRLLNPSPVRGGRILLSRGFSPEQSIQTITAEHCTVVLGVPTLFQMWRESPAYRDADFRHIHFFINGGAYCPPELMDAWRKEKNVVFRQGYGLTEVGPNCFP